jgi:hypothetical protein
MKTIIPLALLVMICAGCANEYVITMTNNATLRTKSKPQKNAQGIYVFKDMEGQTKEISSLRVRSIEAVSRGETPKLPWQK